MSKITFAIVGNGWRARLYIRIAKHFSDKYELSGVLCRDINKAEALQEEYDIFATVSEEDIVEKKPDFIVVAVSKNVISNKATYWRKKGFTVLCETPVGMSLEELKDTWNAGDAGRLVVAEQYLYYPTYKKLRECVESGKIGEPVSAYISLCHEYHGISLMRAFINESYGSGFKLFVHKNELPISKTGDRFSHYYDGEIIRKCKTSAMVEFSDGKAGIYDFDSEQYHSLIRNDSVKISGTRGEIINEKLWYLDDDNMPQCEMLIEDLQAAKSEACEVLSEDEIAIEGLLQRVYAVSKNDYEMIKWQENNLKNALTDAYFALLMKEAVDEWVESERMPWMQ